MPKAVASPTMQADMDYWTGVLGGKSLGIVRNPDTHKTGFHMAGFEIPSHDYSRRHDPGKPFNLTWCCAGDFGHDGNPVLRAFHAALLGRLMNGEHPTIDEFIGQPWPERPVYYWSRWNGVKTLSRYTGAGHYAGKGGWSHISQRRSTANVRPNLWTPRQAPSTPASVFKGDKTMFMVQRTGNPAVFISTGKEGCVEGGPVHIGPGMLDALTNAGIPYILVNSQSELELLTSFARTKEIEVPQQGPVVVNLDEETLAGALGRLGVDVSVVLKKN